MTRERVEERQRLIGIAADRMRMTFHKQPWAALIPLALVQLACLAGPNGDVDAGLDAGQSPVDEASDAPGPVGSDAPGLEDSGDASGDEFGSESGETEPPTSGDGGAVLGEGAGRGGADADADADGIGVGGDTGARTDAAATDDAGQKDGSGLCTYGSPTNGTGSFTWYYFGQGTSQQDGEYLTACGYQGRETGMIDTVENIASTSPASSSYFAAIPGSSGFNTVSSCGACVEIVNGGTSVVATIVDECPTDNGQNPLCSRAGHLDLSYAAWKALGYPSGDPSGTTWKFVSCPISGAITTRLKSGNTDQLYIENTTFPIVSVTSDGQQAHHLSYGAWQLANGMAAAGSTLTLQDIEGHSTTIQVAGGGDTGEQLSGACDGP
jgi:hypothetical protein